MTVSPAERRLQLRRIAAARPYTWGEWVEASRLFGVPVPQWAFELWGGKILDGELTCSVVCKNTAEQDGFDPCLPDGTRTEPLVGVWVEPLYICNRCGAVLLVPPEREK